MQNNTLAQVVGQGFLDQWSAVSRVKKPIIAAVNGFAVTFFDKYISSIFCGIDS